VLLAACATTPSVVPPFLERTYVDFWQAIAALDFDGAERLSTMVSQRDYVRALRAMAAGHLDEAQKELAVLARFEDSSVAKKAEELLFVALMERPSEIAASLRNRSARRLIQALLAAARRESWTFPDGPVVQPLRRRDPIVLVDVAINARHARVGLDTGAIMTVIGPRLADQLGLEPSPTKLEIIDTHGERAAASLGSVHVALGGIQIERHPVLVLPPSLSAKEGSIPLAGFDAVLGWNAIRELRITIDNPQRTIAFDRPLSFSARQDGFFWVGRPWVRARAQNGFPLTLLLDTGAVSLIAPSLVAPAGLRWGEYSTADVMGGVTVRRENRTIYRRAGLYVGGEFVRIGALAARSMSESAYASPDGVLGGDALTHGRVTIDFRAGELSISGAR
jgi:predicted aspartyl protease